MNDTNCVIFIGRLTRDPEVRFMTNGTALASLSVATNREWKQGEEKKSEVSYVDCSAWGKLGELCGQHLTKGSKVLVQGRLKQDRWEKDGKKMSKLTVVAESVQFLGKQGAEAESVAPAESADDDIPF